MPAIDMADFAEEVRGDDPISVVGCCAREGPVAGVRRVVAPAGIVSVNAAEMILTCGAGTPLDEVRAALDDVGQMLLVDDAAGVDEVVARKRVTASTGSVGGALALAASTITRLGYGPARDTLLQARVVTAAGNVVNAGGPTVKNVTGFDLCRLLVGSRGTLAALGELMVRTRPRPLHRGWFSAIGRDPSDVRRALFRPVAVLWDGITTWVCLDGHPADVAAQAAVAELVAVKGPPPIPRAARRSLPPSELRRLDRGELGEFVAEIGVGTVHLADASVAAQALPEPDPDPHVVALSREIKRRFDPGARLNPGREPFAAARPAVGARP